MNLDGAKVDQVRPYREEFRKNKQLGLKWQNRRISITYIMLNTTSL